MIIILKLMVYKTQLPHKNITNMNKFRLKICLPVVVQPIYFNYRIEHRLILSMNNMQSMILRPEGWGGGGGGGGGGKHNFFSFHICDRAAEDKQVEKKPDQNPTVHS